ncbi:hypothetical protein K443DRAFT_71944, partial [Laccaria amethystina LaAM-08-1]
KAFNIFTVIALTTLINGSSAFWWDCKQKEWIIDRQNMDGSRTYCRSVMGRNLMGGAGFFGLTPKDWCD